MDVRAKRNPRVYAIDSSADATVAVGGNLHIGGDSLVLQRRGEAWIAGPSGMQHILLAVAHGGLGWFAAGFNGGIIRGAPGSWTRVDVHAHVEPRPASPVEFEHRARRAHRIGFVLGRGPNRFEVSGRTTLHRGPTSSVMPKDGAGKPYGDDAAPAMRSETTKMDVRPRVVSSPRAAIELDDRAAETGRESARVVDE